MVNPEHQQGVWYRYFQLGVLVLGSGAIYPLIYLRQNFEVTILQSFGIDAAQLGACYSLLGIMFVLTYLPSGWLADRISPRYLVSFSLFATALLGIWFSRFPEYSELRWIFAGWGITTGLTLWASLIKGVSLLSRAGEQGRFFGILDGGRGLVEAIFASIAVGLFAWYLNEQETNLADSLQTVIYMYVGIMLVMAPVIFLTLDNADASADKSAGESEAEGGGREAVGVVQFGREMLVLVSNPRLWMAALVLMFGYQLFWATYSFSAYMQDGLGMAAVTVGTITVAKLWMRPIGAICAGFIGDVFQCEKVLALLMVIATLALLALTIVPASAGVSLIIGLVLLIGLLTYAVRGLYWSTLDGCQVPARIRGMAIGLMSLLGYAPDIYLPWINGYLLTQYPGKTGYIIYFAVIAVGGFVGAAIAWRMYRRPVVETAVS